MPNTVNLAAFKAYDIRGRIPEELNEELAYDIGRAYAAFVKPRRVAVGRDIRLTSTALAAALKRGLLDSGCEVRDIGLTGTEGVYFATFAFELDGGIMVTASHNPPDYNGMKLVREESRPISSDTGLADMRALIQAGTYPEGAAAWQRKRTRHGAEVSRTPSKLRRSYPSAQTQSCRERRQRRGRTHHR